MAYRTQSADTSEQAERVQIALLRAAPPWRKLALLDDLNRTVRRFALAHARRRQPDASSAQLWRTLAGAWLGDDSAVRAYGPAATRMPDERTLLETDAIAVTLLVTEQFEALGVPYVLGGSLASGAQGIYHATNAADLLADLRLAHAEPLAAALQGAFYLDLEALRDAIRTHGSCNFIHLRTMFKVDLFIARPRRFDQSQLARRVPCLVRQDPPRTLYMASPEDTILAKLEWYLAGGGVSDRQWNDILGVLKVQADTLDRAYLDQWAPSLRVAGLLDRALIEAGLTSGMS